MADVKTKVDEEKLNYQMFEEKVEKEYPNPIFCYGEDKELAELYKKNHPESTIYESTWLGTALCVDSHAAIMLKYELIGAQRAHTYMSSKYFKGLMDINMDFVRLLDEIGEGGD